MKRQAMLLGFFAWLSGQRLPIGVASAMLVVVALALLPRMPLQLLPEVRYPQVRVIGDYPGRTSQVIEESVNEALETALGSLEGLVRMESRAGDGRSYVELFFQPGHDLDRGVQDVMQGVSRARAMIPPEFPEPRVFRVGTIEEPVMQLAFSSQAKRPDELRQVLRADLLPRLRAIPGVEAAFIGREEDRELVVELDQDRLRAFGVSLADVERHLTEGLAPAVDGAVRTREFEGVATLRVLAWEEEELRGIPLPRSPTGRSLTLGDVAEVRRERSEESLRARLDGDPAVLVTVHRSERARSLAMARAVRAAVERSTRDPGFSGVRAEFLFDDSLVTGSAVRSVATAALAGSVLAMLLIGLGLRRWRGVPVVMWVVAVSLAGSGVLLHLGGQSLNLLTLAGLLLSVGLGLDYSIIFHDRLDRLRRGGAGGPPAARAAAEVLAPLTGALVTTVGAILPFLLVEGLIAQLFRPLIVTVVVTGLVTFLVALVMLPAFAPRVESPARHAPAAKPREAAARSGSWRIFATLAVLPLGLGLMWAASRALSFEVLPVVDDGFVQARLLHPPGVPLEELDGLTREVEARLAALDGTETVFATVGGYFREGMPSFRPGTSNFLVRVNTEGDSSSAEWAERARAAMDGLGPPGLRLAVTPPRIRGVQTRLADADVIVVLTRADGNLLALADEERKVVEIMERTRGLVDVERMRGGVSPRWRIEPDRVALAEQGIEESALRSQLAYLLDGRVLRQRVEQGEPLGLRLRLKRDADATERVMGARLVTDTAASLHLGDVAEFRLVEEPMHLERREGQRVVRVAAGLDPAGPPPGRVLADLQAALGSAAWSEGVSWWTEGEVEALEETKRTFRTASGMALLTVFAWLWIQFRRLGFAVATMLVVPLGAIGCFALLFTLSRPVDAMVLAGLLIAIGITANNAILVLSEAVSPPRDSRDLVHRLRAAGRRRLRPVLLTTLSTVLGMSPLVWGGAEVLGLLQPLAIALTGALLLSIVLSCFVLPDVAAALSGRRASRAGGQSR